MSVAALRPWRDDTAGKSGTHLVLWCPGCDRMHRVEIDPQNSPCWTFDGNLERPTVTPSIKVEGVQWEPGQHFHKPTHHVDPGGQIICHSFVTNGQWVFLADCTHHLLASVVDLPELPEGIE